LKDKDEDRGTIITTDDGTCATNHPVSSFIPHPSSLILHPSLLLWLKTC
jgi:hypothetical protein